MCELSTTQSYDETQSIFHFVDRKNFDQNTRLQLFDQIEHHIRFQ